MNPSTGICGESARELTYIVPAKRRVTEYEAVSLRQQWETGGFDKGPTCACRPSRNGRSSA
jgi:hypothetical protein